MPKGVRERKAVRSAKRRSDVVSDNHIRRRNQLCDYCGSLPVSQLTKGHVRHWVESHPTWRSPVTRRNAITIVLAAFNHARDMHDVPHKLKGLKKPPSRPRLQSFSEEDEAGIYEATDDVFGDFLFAAIHTGLRPFCELARITADEVVETERGMMRKTPLPEGVTEGAFVVALSPHLFQVGDSITRCMMQRIRSMLGFLAEARQVIYTAVRATGRPYTSQVEAEREAHRELGQSHTELQGICLTGADARVREACITLVQVYAEFHPAARLDWLGISDWALRCLAVE